MSTAKSILGAAMKGFKKEWPKIATGLGAGLLVVGGYLLGRETPRYEAEIQKKEEEKGEKLTVKEKLPIAAKHFAVPAGTLVTGTVLTVASAIENNRRIGVGATAAALSEIATKNLDNYKDAAKEIVGEENADKIQQKANEKLAEKFDINPLNDDLIASISNETEYWCYDLFCGGKPFRTTVNKLHALENELTSRILHGGDGTSISLSEAYEEMGHEYGSIADNVGWIFDSDKSHSDVRFNVSAMLKNGEPVLTIAPEVVLLTPENFSTISYSNWR